MKLEEVRCPKCGKKFAEHLEGGVLVVWCRYCRKLFTIDRTPKAMLA